MEALLQQIGIGTIFIVLVVAIPALVKFIAWCRKTWQTREDFRQLNINEGRRIEQEEEAQESRFEDGEARMKKLEGEVSELKNTLNSQNALIELLIASDELNTKAWIKAQHEIWVPRGCIDSQTLDLLEQRFAIYEEEGGNSWALKLMNELRALPVITSIPVFSTANN